MIIAVMLRAQAQSQARKERAILSSHGTANNMHLYVSAAGPDPISGTIYSAFVRAKKPSLFQQNILS
ncbi:MAG: hypothetical protein JWQ09_2333 [Segetibacter sp.]|nr:hypothetical protein [Segetibacter sp.]